MTRMSDIKSIAEFKRDAERYRRLRLRGCYVDEYRNQYTEELDAICDALPPSDSARPTPEKGKAVKCTAVLLLALSFASMAIAAPVTSAEPSSCAAYVSFSSLLERLANLRKVFYLFEGAEKENTGKG